MPTWSTTTPAGTATWAQGAESIRDWRSLIEDAMNIDGRFPIVAATPAFVHKFKFGNTAARPTAAYTGRLYWNTQTLTIQRDTGADWEHITAPRDLIPTGKKMIFYNVSAPAGWTQVTTWNDYTVRITSGAGGGTGGTDSISTPPEHDHGAVTENPDVDLDHTHPITTEQGNFSGGGFPPTGLIDTASQVATITGASGDVDHTHDVDSDVAFAPKYANCIVCQR